MRFYGSQHRTSKLERLVAADKLLVCGDILLLASFLGLLLWADSLVAAQDFNFKLTDAVRVRGMATDSNANRVNDARLDAMRKAIEQEGVVQVKDFARVEMNQLVSQYTYAHAEGFVEHVREIGEPKVQDGLYIQEYYVWVRKGPLNLELISNKIEVRYLYDSVMRPRICVAVDDEWKTGESASTEWLPDVGARSRAAIENYFLEMHKGFIFKDLSLMRNSRMELEDYVKEARRNQFDILIVGKTRSSLRQVIKVGEANPWSIKSNDPLFNKERFVFNTDLDWSVINVSIAQSINRFSDHFVPNENEGGRDAYDTASARNWSRQQVLDRGIPRLFLELISYWNRPPEIEIVIQTQGEVNALDLLEMVRDVCGEQSNPVQQSAGVYRAKITTSLTEISVNLGKRLGPDWALTEVRWGKIEFSRANQPGRNLLLSVTNCSASSADGIQKTLKELNEIGQVTLTEFRGGEAVFSITTKLDSRQLAVLLEKTITGLRCSEFGEGRIKADIVDSK